MRGPWCTLEGVSLCNMWPGHSCHSVITVLLLTLPGRAGQGESSDSRAWETWLHRARKSGLWDRQCPAPILQRVGTQHGALRMQAAASPSSSAWRLHRHVLTSSHWPPTAPALWPLKQPLTPGPSAPPSTSRLVSPACNCANWPLGKPGSLLSVHMSQVSRAETSDTATSQGLASSPLPTNHFLPGPGIASLRLVAAAKPGSTGPCLPIDWASKVLPAQVEEPR